MNNLKQLTGNILKYKTVIGATGIFFFLGSLVYVNNKEKINKDTNSLKEQILENYKNIL